MAGLNNPAVFVIYQVYEKTNFTNHAIGAAFHEQL